jgi:hypothetical protein
MGLLMFHRSFFFPLQSVLFSRIFSVFDYESLPRRMSRFCGANTRSVGSSRICGEAPAGFLCWEESGTHQYVLLHKTRRDTSAVSRGRPFRRHFGACPECSGSRWLREARRERISPDHRSDCSRTADQKPSTKQRAFEENTKNSRKSTDSIGPRCRSS